MSAFLALALAQVTPLVPAPVATAPPPAPANWRAMPLSAGTWLHRAVPGGSEAVFASSVGPQLTLRCTLATRRLGFFRTGAAPALQLRVVTTGNGDRVLPPGNAVVNVDPLLDAIAFSRGRFAVAGGGAPLLIVPTWAEPARAIEDCRK